eukprot:10878275-Karenia_brevis.AAC.1
MKSELHVHMCERKCEVGHDLRVHRRPLFRASRHDAPLVQDLLLMAICVNHVPHDNARLRPARAKTISLDIVVQ